MSPRFPPREIRIWAVVALSTVGGASAQTSSHGLDVWTTANVVGQATGEDDIRAELAMSLDLFADVPLGPSVLHLYVEANTTPRTNGVSTRVPFVNMDAGTALDADGEGRVQISELRLAWPVHDAAALHAGLMDLTGFLDVSRISNDENLFFLAQPFVNNPTIVFPDYTLGSALVVDVPGWPGGEVAVSLASSHGLADDPEASYERLFDFGAESRGSFMAGRARAEGDRWRGTLGAWASTGERVGRLGEILPARGLFSVVGFRAGIHSVSGRLGIADGDAGSESFVGFTYLGTVASNAVGLGVATGPALPEYVGRRGEHAEAFMRRSIREVLYLTSSIQWLSRAFLPEGDVDGGIWIFGFRVSATVPAP